MQRYLLRPELPPLPPSWRKLPVERRGYPVPKFVDKVAGEWDFRVSDGRYLKRAVAQRLCWLCGERLPAAGLPASFVIGSMCAVNRTTSEPPSHLECARYAVRVCPFMVRPRAKRRMSGLPLDQIIAPPGEHLDRNPGAMCVWSTPTWSWFRAGHGRRDLLCELGPATSVEWYAEGRPATRDEVTESVESGLHFLESAAAKDGPSALAQLAFMVEEARALFPRAEVA